MKRAAYASAVGEEFTVFAEHLDDEVTMELVEVSEIRHTGPLVEFSLDFVGPRRPPLAEGTYTLQHEAVGSDLVHLVPARPSETGMGYHAVISHRPPA